MTKNKLFIVTGAEGAGKTLIITELEKIVPFYWINYFSTRSTGEKGFQKTDWQNFQKMAEEDKFVLSFKKRDYLVGITYEELEKANNSGKPIVWEVDAKWVEDIKNEYPDAIVILVNGIEVEDLYRHFESKGHDVPAAIAIQAQRSNRINKSWHQGVNYVIENKKGASAKAAQSIKEIIEKYASNQQFLDQQKRDPNLSQPA